MSMQSYRNEKSRVMTPYTRRNPASPYMFSGRNLDYPRGRIHNPNDNRREVDSLMECKSNVALSSIENVFPPAYRHRDALNGEISTVREVTVGRSSDSAIRNDFQRNFDDFKPRVPAQMIGKLSLTDSREAVTRRENTAREIESVNVKTKLSNEDYFRKRRESQMRLLTGSVEKVLSWFKLKNNFNILFEVIAPLIDLKLGKFPTEKCLLLRDENTGPTLLATFYEIDRPMPAVAVGSVVKCIGRLTSPNCLHAFRVEQSSDEERSQSQRLIFISNLVAEEEKGLLTKK